MFSINPRYDYRHGNYANGGTEERDYSILGTFTPKEAEGNCVYYNHCQPCPSGLNVGLINKYYDLAMAGDSMDCSP